MLEQAQGRIVSGVLPLHHSGTNSYSGFGLFSKLGYMMINNRFVCVCVRELEVNEILMEHFAKHN